MSATELNSRCQQSYFFPEDPGENRFLDFWLLVVASIHCFMNTTRNHCSCGHTAFFSILLCLLLKRIPVLTFKAHPEYPG